MAATGKIGNLLPGFTPVNPAAFRPDLAEIRSDRLFVDAEVTDGFCGGLKVQSGATNQL